MSHLSLAVFFSVLLLPVANADESASDVLARMAQLYGSVQSYKDSGVVLVHSKDDQTSNEITFETAFARPNLFRFAWVSHHPYPPLRHIEWRSVIWSDGKAAYSKYNYDSGPAKIETQESLLMAIAGATGVSGGAAYGIPMLLMTETGESSIAKPETSTLGGIESIEGTNCYHILAAIPRIGPIELWVGTEDHLIRKIQMRLGGFLSEEIHRNIHVDTAISAESFTPQ